MTEWERRTQTPAATPPTDEADEKPTFVSRHPPPAWVDRVVEYAPRAPGYDHALRAINRDREFGGGLLAGALAFRLFGAMLPIALLISVLLGYASQVAPEVTQDAGRSVGIGATLLDSVSESAKLSDGSRWWVMITSFVAVVWSAIWAAKAIRAVHSLAWNGGVGKLKQPLQAAFVLLAAIAGMAAVVGLAGRARAELGPPGILVLTVVAFGCFFAIWLGLSWLLPHGDAPLKSLIPGAIVFALGVQVIHLGTVLFIAGKVERASETYGALGVAFTILFWLYMISRVIVASAMLNSAVDARRRAAVA